jgi:hypothetical protein
MNICDRVEVTKPSSPEQEAEPACDHVPGLHSVHVPPLDGSPALPARLRKDSKKRQDMRTMPHDPSGLTTRRTAVLPCRRRKGTRHWTYCTVPSRGRCTRRAGRCRRCSARRTSPRCRTGSATRRCGWPDRTCTSRPPGCKGSSNGRCTGRLSREQATGLSRTIRMGRVRPWQAWPGAPQVPDAQTQDDTEELPAGDVAPEGPAR